MPELIIDTYDSEYFYQYSFDELIEKVPYNAKEEKKYITLRKYPVIFVAMSKYLSGHYDLSRTELEVMATVLGMSKIQHDVRIPEISNLSKDISGNSDDLRLIDRMEAKCHYFFATLESNNGRINLATCEWVNNTINKLSSDLGLLDSQLSIAAFFIGIESSEYLPPNKAIMVTKEVKEFWDFVDLRLKRLRNCDL